MKSGLQRRGHWVAKFGALAAAVTLIVTGCTAGDDQGEESGVPGELNYGYDWGVSSFDPAKAVRSQDNPWLFPVYDRLIHQLPSGEPSGGLAESWEFDEDGTTLTLHVRQGVTFHDGEALDAEAVKANLDRSRAGESAVAAELITIESVDVIDDATVDVHLTTPNASLILVLSERPGMLVSPAAFDNEDLGRAPVGAGMFKVVEYTEGSSAVYEPYEDYWDPEAIGVSKLTIYEMPDAATRRSALQSGQLNWAKIATADAATFEGDENFTVEYFDSLSYINLPMNRSREFFSDVRVRQAMNFAIDRQAILDAIYSGHGTLSVQPFPQGYFAYNDDYGPDTYAYDPEKAMELLGEAGYPDGFTFENLVPSTGDGPRIAEAVQAQLAEVGITMNIRQIDPTQSADLWGVQRVGDTLQGTWGGRPDPSATLYVQYHEKGFFNTGAYVDEEIQRLYPLTLSTLDPDARAEVLQEASGRVVEEALDIVILFPSIANVIATNIEGAEPYRTGPQDFRGVHVNG